jgi:hypothetical protein
LCSRTLETGGRSHRRGLHVDLRHLSIDMARDVLEEWLRLNRLSGDVYEALPDAVKEWARDNGGGFGTLLPTLALMDPVRRETAGAVVEGLLRTLEEVSDSLSQGEHMIDLTDERPGEAEMDDQTERRLTTLEQQMALAIDLMRDHLASCPAARGAEAPPSAPRGD